MSGECGVPGAAGHAVRRAAIARIYNQGIAGRTATFETRLRDDDDVLAWFGRRFPVVVVEAGRRCRRVCEHVRGTAPRECYAGIAEFSVYVAPEHRGRGAGRLAMETLIEAARDGGLLEAGVAGVHREPRQPRRCCASRDFARLGSTNAMRRSRARGRTS